MVCSAIRRRAGGLGVSGSVAITYRERKVIARRMLDQHWHEVPDRPVQFRVRQPDRCCDHIGMQVGETLLESSLHLGKCFVFRCAVHGAMLRHYQRGRNCHFARCRSARSPAGCRRSKWLTVWRGVKFGLCFIP